MGCRAGRCCCKGRRALSTNLGPVACTALDEPPCVSRAHKGSPPAGGAPPLSGRWCSPGLTAWLVLLEPVPSCSATRQKSVIRAGGQRALPRRRSHPCLLVTLISRDTSEHVRGAGPGTARIQLLPALSCQSRPCPWQKQAHLPHFPSLRGSAQVPGGRPREQLRQRCLNALFLSLWA